MNTKNSNNTKSIIVYVPSYFHGFREIIEKHLGRMGFEVYSIKDSPDRFKLKGILKPLVRISRRVFLGDRNYQSNLNEIRLEKLVAEQLKMVETADYALIFRPDELSIKSLKQIKSKTAAMYAYQWDGFARFPRIFERLKLFKKVYSIDINDVRAENNVFPEKNFFFDIDFTVSPQVKERHDRAAYYIGVYEKKRVKRLQLIVNQLSELKIKTEINLLGCPVIIPAWVNRLKKSKQYVDVINEVKSSNIIIDIDVRETHDVLTFRIFEAIGYKKKLITTNELVKNCDFYHPSNIYVFNGSIDGLKKFLDEPMVSLPDEILKKHSFTEWVKRVLEIS
jgi:hypothetical protein